MNAIVKAGPDLDRLREERDLAAHCAALDPVYLPIFERLDAECAARSGLAGPHLKHERKHHDPRI